MITFERLARYLEAKLGIEIYGVKSVNCDMQVTFDCNDDATASHFRTWTRDLPEKDSKKALVYAFLNKHEDMNLFRDNSLLIELTLEWESNRSDILNSLNKYKGLTGDCTDLEERFDRISRLAKIAKYTESQIELDMAILGI